MPITIHCQCGANIRLPDEAAGRSFRCPKCKTIVAGSGDAAGIVAQPAPSSGAPSTCPICQSPVMPTDAQIACPACQQTHHQECWTEIGGCSTYGCSEMPAAAKDAAEDLPLAAWGDTKNCPVCGERIKSIALKCRYCRTEFNSTDPLTLRDMHRQEVKGEATRKLQNTVWVLFFVSLLVGCMAPIMFFVNLAWLLTQRRKLAAAGPFYLILAYSALGLTSLYSILMALFYLFEG